jgi:hypothetical protein
MKPRLGAGATSYVCGLSKTLKRRPPFAAVSPPNLETSAPFTSVLSPARANTETGAVVNAGSQAPADVAFPPKRDSRARSPLTFK